MKVIVSAGGTGGHIYPAIAIINKIKEMFNHIFKSYLNDLETNNVNSSICKVFLNKMSEEYKKNTSNERIVIDYISGMTDDFFVNEYNKLSS